MRDEAIRPLPRPEDRHDPHRDIPANPRSHRWLLSSLLIGTFAGSIAKHVGVAIEIRILAFVALAGMALAIWHVGRRAPEAAVV